MTFYDLDLELAYCHEFCTSSDILNTEWNISAKFMKIKPGVMAIYGDEIEVHRFR